MKTPCNDDRSSIDCYKEHADGIDSVLARPPRRPTNGRSSQSVSDILLLDAPLL